MSTTPLAPHFPRYSEIYLQKKKEIEQKAKDDIKALNDMHDHYETLISIVRKHPLPRESKITLYPNDVRFTITLLPGDSLFVLAPIISALAQQYEKPIPYPSAGYFGDTIFFSFYIKGKSLTIEVDVPSRKLSDAICTSEKRITETTNYNWYYHAPFWLPSSSVIVIK